MTNIAFAKIGKSIKFNTPFSPIGGDNEAPSTIEFLARHNPDKTFYLIGRSDFKKISEERRIELFPYNNVVDVYKHMKPLKNKDGFIPNTLDAELARLNVKIDFSILMVGQVGTVTIPNKIKQIKHPELTASIIDMTLNYSTPIIEWLNANQHIPFVELINDPRYVLNQARDIIPNPKVSLSQYDGDYIKSTIESYDNQEKINHIIPMQYAEMEKMFLYRKEKPCVIENKRNILFSIVLNEGKPSRYNLLKDWVLNKCDDVSIFGKWDEKYTENDCRFVGSVKIDEIQTKFNNVKCTFIIPIKDGWVTSKYIEMIHAGVIPFFHPSYDRQDHLKVPQFLRPKNSKELFDRIEQLKDDALYVKIISKLQETYCLPEYYDGTKLNNIIMSSMIHDYKMVNKNNFVEQTELSSVSLF